MSLEMLFSWLRRRRRRKILSQPFPDGWEGHLQRNVAHYGRLAPDEREKLKQLVQVFVAEKYWEGCGGLEVTDEVKVTIAGQACLLLLGFEGECFDRLLTVLVYPGDFFAKDVDRRGGLVLEGASWKLGEAWHGGPVILSWPHVLEGGRDADAGVNVVLHEFAHVLDGMDHEFDGTPPLQSIEQYRTWQEVMTAEYERLVDEAERGRPTLLDEYGAESEAEFFAVATECFFERPREMAARHPRLYGVLRDFYRQDPAARSAEMH